MSPSASQSQLKFLLDENVKKRLLRFLRAKNIDVITAPKGISNGKLAILSKLEKRILVTNDSDFIDSELFPKDNIFSVIWLKIPQNKPETLLKRFSLLLKKKSKPEDFEGHSIILKEKKFKIFPIISIIKILIKK